MPQSTNVSKELVITVMNPYQSQTFANGNTKNELALPTHKLYGRSMLGIRFFWELPNACFDLGSFYHYTIGLDSTVHDVKRLKRQSCNRE